jgi:16S rRNA (guanine527-N7)-methyltransferase
MVTLIDSNERRTAFLQASVDAMFGTDRVFVVRARAEEFGRDDARRGTFDTVTARSFGPPAVTAECAAALRASRGGIIITVA